MPEPTTRPSRGRLRSCLAALGKAFWASPVPAYVSLHLCERCGSDAVCQVDWEELDDQRWEIDLRCGECGHWRTTVADNEEAASYELRLARQTGRIQAAMERLDRERMVAEVEQLAHALRNDLIDAADFAR